MNAFKLQQQEKKAADLKARCEALLRSGSRVEALRLYRGETGCSLNVAMQALGLKSA